MFEIPTQVAFVVMKDLGETELLYGIGYGNEIICACCGGVFELDEVLTYQRLPWVDISEAIK